MQRVSQFENEYALSVAHRRDAAGQLYDIASRVYENLPPDAELRDLLYGPNSVRPAPFTLKPQ